MVFEFDRYINGQLMAEGVTIERQKKLADAMREAARIASRGPNGEVPVLVLRALAERAGGVKVKPLEWRKGRAETPFGPYHVIEETNDDEPFWFVMFNGKAAARCGTHDDEESAILAAQADYEARILSALEPSAARELALEEAAKLLEREACELDGLVDSVSHHLRSKARAIRALSSPDHANAGKVEGDGWSIDYEVYSGDEWQAASTDLDGALDYALMYALDGMENITVQEVRRRTVHAQPASEGAE